MGANEGETLSLLLSLFPNGVASETNLQPGKPFRIIFSVISEGPEIEKRIHIHRNPIAKRSAVEAITM
jgi:hypothetical protein